MRRPLVDFGHSTPLGSGSHRRRLVLCHAKVGPVAPGEERLGIPSTQRFSRNTCLVCLKEEETMRKSIQLWRNQATTSNTHENLFLTVEKEVSWLGITKSPLFPRVNHTGPWWQPTAQSHWTEGREVRKAVCVRQAVDVYGKQCVCKASGGCVSAWSGRDKNERKDLETQYGSWNCQRQLPIRLPGNYAEVSFLFQLAEECIFLKTFLSK